MAKLKEFVAMIEREANTKVKRIRSDNGGEYDSKESHAWFRTTGIQWEPTVAYTLEQNGVSERLNRTLIERVVAVIYDFGLNKSLWAEVAKSIIHIKNRSPTAALKSGITPYEAWYNQKPDVSHLRILGCTAWAHTKKERRKKLDSHSRRCQLVGYEGTTIYRVWDPVIKQVIRVRDVVFDEQEVRPVPSTEKGGEGGTVLEYGTTLLPSGSAMGHSNTATMPAIEAEHEPMTTVELEPESQDEPEAETAPIEWERSQLSDIAEEPESSVRPTIEPATMRASEPPTTSATVAKPRKAKRSASEPVEPLRRSERAKRGLLAVVPAIGTDPTTIREARESQDSEKWEAAMVDELQALEKNKTWTLVDLPHGRKALKGKWVYKAKLGSDGAVLRHKDRWVVKGYEQKYGLDYDQTFAIVVKPTMFKTVFALAAVNDWEIEHMDVKSAFLQGKLDDEVYVEQPTGFAKDKRVCRLNRSLYGLKQSPRVWYQTIAAFLIKIGYKPTHADKGLFVNSMGDIVVVYVDDLLLVGPSLERINQLKDELRREFEMSDLGPLSYYLGI